MGHLFCELPRGRTGGLPTDRGFTGHQAESSLYFMKARFYDPVIGRFLQPDSVVPDPSNPQSLNRYSYVYNNPMRYTDPYGYWPEWVDDAASAVTGFVTETAPNAGRGAWRGVQWGWRNSAQARAASWWIASRTIIPGGPSLLDEAVQAVWNSPPFDAACGSLGPACGVVETAATIAADPISLYDMGVDALTSVEVLDVPVGTIAAIGLTCGPASLSLSKCGGVLTGHCRWSCVSNGIQMTDIAPLGPLGLPLDLAALAVLEVDIARSGCFANPGLHAAAATNFGVGLIGALPPVSIPASAAEGANYAATTGALATC